MVIREKTEDWTDGTLIFNKISQFSSIQSLIFPPSKPAGWRSKFEINGVYCGPVLPWSIIFSSPRYQTILAWGLAFLARQVSDFSEPACRVTVLSVLTNSSLEGGTEIFSLVILIVILTSHCLPEEEIMSELLGVLGKQLLLQNKAAFLPQPQ